jgi:hypothetical protein
LPVLHGVPFATGGALHNPLAGAQVPAVVQGPVAAHTTGFEPTHDPSLQE